MKEVFKEIWVEVLKLLDSEVPYYFLPMGVLIVIWAFVITFFLARYVGSI